MKSYSKVGNYFVKNRRFLRLIVLYAAVFVFTYLLFTLVKPMFSFISNGTVAHFISALFVLFGVLWAIMEVSMKKLTPMRAIAILFLVAVGVRIGYLLCTFATARQYDTYSYNNNGHEAYAWTIFSQNKLPSNNSYQFYHPPLNAMLQALFMRITDVLSVPFVKLFGLGDKFYSAYVDGVAVSVVGGDLRRAYLFSTCQILSVFYSVATMVVGYKIMKELGIKGYGLVFCFAIFAFFPRHILFAAQLNNDPLSYLFSLTAIYFTIKWWKDKKLKNILLIALCVGFGMMSKLSSVTVCLPIAIVFLIEFVKSVKKRSGALTIDKIIVQYASFLAISFPLGLWFQVYAYIRFDQPFGYVFPYLSWALSTEHKSLFERFFFTFDINEYFGSLYLRNFIDGDTGMLNNYNVWYILIKSAIFGEFSFWNGDTFAIASILFELMFVCLLLIATVVAFVYYIVERKDKKSIIRCDDLKSKAVTLLLFLTLSQIVSYLFFYLKMPYACTADFRYIMPLIICIALIGEFAAQKLSKKGNVFKIFVNAMKAVGVVFIISSTLFYMVCI